ncbi:hypothetical protein [Sorangium sp. So ce693]|uniref:hypothetical protein n=1 Tax=Sorangium sp. So ce693 TaxID=3133318 RepID=UPI003F5E1870
MDSRDGDRESGAPRICAPLGFLRDSIVVDPGERGARWSGVAITMDRIEGVPPRAAGPRGNKEDAKAVPRGVDRAVVVASGGVLEQVKPPCGSRKERAHEAIDITGRNWT